ncbi:GAF domain-containing protein [Vulgatibacter incomptus]|uniref:GAF domain protein n=1 Tax=Vulgatibacter incomptus TaxID=1391653 RepID=A0A0K1PB88_9BACT|nr:GAF domain-containing protein [Vulgatibacter incomptus]AKU90798.1 GAF domain protein [Vulgatibacter incomptus]
MAEGIYLPPIPRGTLLPEPARVERLQQALPLILATTEGETDAVAIQATLATLLWDALPQASWCGFYRTTAPGMLTVGPYRGPMGCLRIPFERGVCGACARTGQTQLVEDVTRFADHIACDDATRSELVVPVFAHGEVVAVLDLDSHQLAAFSAREAEVLEAFLSRAFATAVF